MARNNPTQDFFNPPSNMSQDFEETYFSELNNDELFYQTNKPKETPDIWRKVGENGAKNTPNQIWKQLVGWKLIIILIKNGLSIMVYLNNT